MANCGNYLFCREWGGDLTWARFCAPLDKIQLSTIVGEEGKEEEKVEEEDEEALIRQ